MAFLCVVVLCFLVGHRFALCFVGFDVLLCCNVVGFGVLLVWVVRVCFFRRQKIVD